MALHLHRNSYTSPPAQQSVPSPGWVYWKQFLTRTVIPLIIIFTFGHGTSRASASDSANGLPASFGSEFTACLNELLEFFNRPIPEIPPGPHPIPFLIGCEIPGCDAGSSGPIDLRIDLRGDVIESANLDIEGLPPNTELNFTGVGEQSLTNPSRFLIGKSKERFFMGRKVARISGIPETSMKHRLTPTRLIDAILDMRSAIAFPAGNISLSFDRAALERLDREARKAGTPHGRELAAVELTVSVTSGKTVLSHRKIGYHVMWCLSLSPDPVHSDPVDQIQLLENEAMGVSFTEEAMVLANGRIPVIGETTAGRWIEPEAFKSATIFKMRENRLRDDGSCTAETYSGTTEQCSPEISVFSQGRGMKLVTPVTSWTDRLGDKAKAEVKGTNSMLKIPIHFYIAWEHSAAPCPERIEQFPCPAVPPTTQSLAENWLTEARTILDNMRSGITFDTPEITSKASNPVLYEAGCADRDLLYPHFDIKPDERPTTVRVFFVQLSKEADINGIPVHANGWACDIPPNGASNDHLDLHRYNDILISTSIANSTTLAHELGHALFLQDLNDAGGDITEPLEWASGLGRCLPPASVGQPGYLEPACKFLMWSGSPIRSVLTKGQSFRSNVNHLSAIHRHTLATRPLDGLSPRDCLDSMRTATCPALTLDIN
ncbi:MAG: hypothetical protein P0111_11070 [Nitrospira sp.]|nr:hypothetical protein [Nitrospira sp.]